MCNTVPVPSYAYNISCWYPLTKDGVEMLCYGMYCGCAWLQLVAMSVVIRSVLRFVGEVQNMLP